MSNQNSIIVCHQRAEPIKKASFIGSNNESSQGHLWGVRGQAKMGKTTLLQHILIPYLKALESSEGWQGIVAYLDLRNLRNSGFQAFLQALIKEWHNFNPALDICKSLSSDLTDTNSLVAVLKQFPNYRPVLLLDEINMFHYGANQEYSSHVHELVTKLVTQHRGVVVLAGRLPTSTDSRLAHQDYLEQRRQILDWEQNLHLEPITLGPFPEECLADFLKKKLAGQTTYQIEQQPIFSRRTGYIPGLCEALINNNVTKENWATFVEQWLFGEVGDESHRTTPPLAPEYKETYSVLQTLSALRYFEPDLLVRFLDELERPYTFETINEFLKTELVIYESPKGYTLGNYRPLLNETLFETNRERWVESHYWAINYYLESINRFRVKPLTFLHELLYHIMRLATYDNRTFNFLIERLGELDKFVHLTRSSVGELMELLQDDEEIKELQQVSEYTQACYQEFHNWLEHFAKPELAPVFIQKPVLENQHLLLPQKHQDILEEIYQTIEGNNGHTTVIGLQGVSGIGKTALQSQLEQDCVEKSDGKAILLTAPGNHSFDFALSEVRSLRFLTQMLAEAYNRATNQPDCFDTYKQLLKERLNESEIEEEWIACYNRGLRDVPVGCTLLMCFDSLEYLHPGSTAFEWLVRTLPRLENSIIVLALQNEDSGDGTYEEGSPTNLLNRIESEAEKSNNKKFDCRRYRLEGFSDSGERVNYLTSVLDEAQIAQLGQIPHKQPVLPVLVEMLKGLIPEGRQAVLDKLSTPSNLELLEQIGRVFWEQIDQQPDSQKQLLGIVALTQRGTTPYMLAFLRSGGDQPSDNDVVQATRELETLYRNPLTRPLLRWRYRQSIDPAHFTAEQVLIPHNILCEFYDRAWDRRKSDHGYRQLLVKYSQQQLNTLDPDHPSYTWHLFDTLYYLRNTNPGEAVGFYLEYQEKSWRRGRWGAVEQFNDEWQLIRRQSDWPPFEPRDIEETQMFEQDMRIRQSILKGDFLRVPLKDFPPKTKNTISVLSQLRQSNLWGQIFLSGSYSVSERENQDDLTWFSQILESGENLHQNPMGKSFLQQAYLADWCFLNGQALYLQLYPDLAISYFNEAIKYYSSAGLVSDTLRTITYLVHISAESGLHTQAALYALKLRTLSIPSAEISDSLLDHYRKWAAAAVCYAQGQWEQTMQLLEPLVLGEGNWTGWHVDWQMITILYLEAFTQHLLLLVRSQRVTISDALEVKDTTSEIFALFVASPKVWSLMRIRTKLLWSMLNLYLLMLVPPDLFDTQHQVLKQIAKENLDELEEESIRNAPDPSVLTAVTLSSKAWLVSLIEDNQAKVEQLLVSTQELIDEAEKKRRWWQREKQYLYESLLAVPASWILLNQAHYELAVIWLGLREETWTKEQVKEILERTSRALGYLYRSHNQSEIVELVLDLLWIRIRQVPPVMWQILTDRDESASYFMKGFTTRRFLDQIHPDKKPHIR